jgi:uncharacterized delta-60 repeat protein
MLESRFGRGLLVTLGCWVVGLLATPLSVAAPGELDPSFGQLGEFALQTNAACRAGCPEFVNSSAQALAVQPDGKLLIAGRNVDNRAAYVEGPQSALVRLTDDGMLDGTFGSGGFAQAPPFIVQRLYVQADGSLMDVGVGATGAIGGAVGVEHYTASGAATSAVQWFAMPLLPHGLPIGAGTPEIDGAGRFVSLGGTIVPLIPHGDEPKLVRFLPTGALDGTFGSSGVVSLRAPDTTETPPSWPATFALSNKGSVFVAASTYLGSGKEERKAHTVIYHFTTKGRLDRPFGRGGMVALPGSGGYEALALAVAPDGGVVLAAGEDVAGPPKRKRLLVVRYTKTGRPDNSFGYEGVIARTWVSHDVIPPHVSVMPNGIVPSAIAFDARGDAVITGSKYTYTPDTGTVGSWFLVRLTHKGFDCSFGPSGVVFGGVRASANAVSLQADERIVIAGERDHGIMAARYMGGGTPRTCPGERKSRTPKHKHRHKRRRHR